MSTTATAQAVRCGNHKGQKIYHANATEVRACYQGSRVAQVDRELTTVTAPSSSQPRNADEARSEAVRRLAAQTSPFFQDRNMGREYPASDNQLNFLRDLANEVLVDQARDALLAKLDTLSSAQAKALITDMVVMRDAKRQRDAERRTAADTTPVATKRDRSALIDAIMDTREERNFCIIDEDGKARFYRVSKRGKRSRRPGTWKIQERVSDSLFPRYDSMLGTVAQAIIDQGGAKKAGERFAELMHRCYECGASLTDTTGNPYYVMGLGPECGAK